MKHLILTALTLLVGFQAEARSIKTFLSADLKEIHFQPGTSLGDKIYSYGSINIGLFGKKQIVLSLQPAQICPAGMYCLAMMPAAITFKVPLQSTEVGACNETIYTGEVNKMPVDGLRTKITVVDNRNNRCMHKRLIDQTEVHLEIETPRPYRNELHSLTGHQLN